MQAGEREARSEGRTTASRGGFLLLHLLNIIRARYTPVIRVSFVSGSQYASRATLAGFSRSFAFDLTLQNAEATKSKICFGMHVNILLTNNPPTHPPHPQNLGGEGGLPKKPSATENKKQQPPRREEHLLVGSVRHRDQSKTEPSKENHGFEARIDRRRLKGCPPASGAPAPPANKQQVRVFLTYRGRHT